MIEISSAGTRSFVQSATSNGGSESRGRPLGTSPTILTPCAVQPEAPDGQGGHDEGDGGADLRERARGALGEPRAEQQGLEAAARPEEERQRPEADRGGDGIDVAEVGHQRPDDLDEGLALRVDAEHGRELAGRDLEAGGGDEARDDRVAEEVREEPQPQQPHGEEHQPRDQGERDGRAEVLRRALGRERAMAAAVIRLATATGPTASVREVPKTA